jgi:hypothetical protein
MALENSIADARKVDGVSQRAGLGFFVGGAHSALAIGIMVKFTGFRSISASSCWSRGIAVWVMLPGNTVEVVVLIHRGGCDGRPWQPGCFSSEPQLSQQ